MGRPRSSNYSPKFVHQAILDFMTSKDTVSAVARKINVDPKTLNNWLCDYGHLVGGQNKTDKEIEAAIKNMKVQKRYHNLKIGSGPDGRSPLDRILGIIDDKGLTKYKVGKDLSHNLADNLYRGRATNKTIHKLCKYLNTTEGYIMSGSSNGNGAKTDTFSDLDKIMAEVKTKGDTPSNSVVEKLEWRLTEAEKKIEKLSDYIMQLASKVK